jgi:hypothetical protein
MGVSLWTLAVDPSLTRTGWALFRKGVLEGSGAIVLPPAKSKLAPKTVAARAARVAHGIMAKLPIYAAYDMTKLELIMEWPQVYRATRSKGDPNGLLGIAAICGALVALANPASVLMKTPAEWIGQLPKATTAKGALTSPRARRILGNLTHDEREYLRRSNEVTHDEIDAIGLGLYALDRLKPVKVFPGATE